MNAVERAAESRKRLRAEMRAIEKRVGLLELALRTLEGGGVSEDEEPP